METEAGLPQANNSSDSQKQSTQEHNASSLSPRTDLQPRSSVNAPFHGRNPPINIQVKPEHGDLTVNNLQTRLFTVSNRQEGPHFEFGLKRKTDTPTSRPNAARISPQRLNPISASSPTVPLVPPQVTIQHLHIHSKRSLASLEIALMSYQLF